MAPAFLKSFLPKRERSQHDRTFWEAVKTITWTQWALFGVGQVLLRTHWAYSIADTDPAGSRGLASELPAPTGPSDNPVNASFSAVDFFSVSLSVSLLEDQFGKQTTDIVRDYAATSVTS